jgi:spore coat polysaccharide biosynthesis protein SpsF
LNSSLRVVASIEARMGSSRLPGKVLEDIHGHTVIGRLVNRLRLCQRLSDVVVATSTASGDDVLVEWCHQNNVPCFRGSEEDVLNRVVGAHKFMGSDLVVEITGDCPMTDPNLIDLGIETFLIHKPDVVTNCGPHLTWPMGQYVQVFPLQLLEEVDLTVSDPAVHEHVSLFFYEHPERYRVLELLAPNRWREPTWRLQLDYPEDLEFQRQIHALLEPIYGANFDTEDIVTLLRQRPDLIELNAHCEEKCVR